MVSASKMPKYLYIFFSPSVLILSWLGSSIPSIRYRLPLFITSMVHFSMPNSIPMSWLYILIACIRVSSSFSFFANSLMSSRWLIFSHDLLSLYPAAHFLSRWLSGIMAIMNSNGESASPWNILLWIFASAKIPSPAFHSFLNNVYDFIWYFVHFEAVYFPVLQDHFICLFVVNPGHR